MDIFVMFCTAKCVHRIFASEKRDNQRKSNSLSKIVCVKSEFMFLVGGKVNLFRNLLSQKNNVQFRSKGQVNLFKAYLKAEISVKIIFSL